jgi:excisionase family DNA binding protein
MNARKAPNPLVDDGFASVDESMEFLSVSRSTVYELMATGELPSAKVGRCRRVPRKALREFAARAMIGAE